jgi:ribonuclease J
MKLITHRGSHQIGGSCVELQANNGDRLLLDAGMPLAQKDGSDWPRGTMNHKSEELRAEGVLPDIDGLYAGSTPKFSALVLSHAHLDHHGLAHHIHPDIPIYASRGTIEMLKVSQIFVPDAVVPSNLHELPDGTVAIGSFTIQGIPVDHVAPDSRALLVEADGQRVLYSGDLRAHGRHPELFDGLPAAAGRVDVLILEGTTIGQQVGSHGFPSELDVEAKLRDLLKHKSGIVFVIASGQNIDRAVSVYRAAHAAGRVFVMDAYQAYVHMVLKDLCPEAPQSGLEGVGVKFVQYHVERLINADLYSRACKMSRDRKVETKHLAAEPDRFVYLARSNGATAALLKKLGSSVRPTVVWSQWSGYLKKGGAVPRFCDEHGIKIDTIHSGGHAHPEDLVRLVSRLQPGLVVPIHTEAAAKFKDLMPNVVQIEDGKVVEIGSLLTELSCANIEPKRALAQEKLCDHK